MKSRYKKRTALREGGLVGAMAATSVAGCEAPPTVTGTVIAATKRQQQQQTTGDSYVSSGDAMAMIPKELTCGS